MDVADEWRVWLHLSLWTIQSSMCFASSKPKLSEVLILRVLLLRPCHCHVKSLVLLTAGRQPRYPTQGQTKLASGSDLQICEGAQPQWWHRDGAWCTSAWSRSEQPCWISVVSSAYSFRCYILECIVVTWQQLLIHSPIWMSFLIQSHLTNLYKIPKP